MQRPQALSRCGDCKLFGTLATKPQACGWGIPECSGPQGTFAEKCPLFTYQNGYMPLLDCADEDLPEWTRVEQTTLQF